MGRAMRIGCLRKTSPSTLTEHVGCANDSIMTKFRTRRTVPYSHTMYSKISSRAVLLPAPISPRFDGPFGSGGERWGKLG